MTTADKVIFWHRDLPPLSAEPLGSHVIEADSHHVSGTFSHRDELWQSCERDLMDRTETRLREEIARLGGRYAHVRSEHIEPRHDEVRSEAWLRGRFDYTLYR